MITHIISLGPGDGREPALFSCSDPPRGTFTRVSFRTLDSLGRGGQANHLTKTDSKLSSQIHEAVVPRPWA